MRSLGVILGLFASFATTSIAATLPNKDGFYLVSASDVVLQDLPIVDMTVTDDRFPGHVFTGSASTVLAEMFAQKPKLFNYTTIDNTLLTLDEPSTSPAASPLQKRLCCGNVNCKTYYPGKEHRIPWGWCVDGIAHLMELGKALCTVAAAPACARVSCSRKCGIFLCSKIDKPVSVYCGDIPKDVNKIGNTCNDGGVWGARDFDTHYTGVRRQKC